MTADTWRPIETAPKDGTPVLVITTHGQYVVQWLTGDRDYEFIDGWYVHDNKYGPFVLRGDWPSHWMPLPAAPSTPEVPKP